MVESGCSKSVGALLDKMVATDTDYRFMAINDLINELQSDSLRLDLTSEKKVVELVLKLLRDPSVEVQSLAVKALGPLTAKVKEQQVTAVVRDLVTTMDNCSDEQLGGICSIGLKTVICALSPVSDSVIVQSAIREALTHLLRMVVSHTDDNVRIEACEVLAEMINQFGNQLANFHMDMLDCMLIGLSCPQNTLRKRATQALGCLAWSVSQKHLASLMTYLMIRLRNVKLGTGPGPQTDEELAQLVTDHPLLQRPHLIAQLKQPASLDLCKTLLQCLNVVARQMLRTPQYLRPVLQLLASILRHSTPGDSQMDDIHELVIQTLETLVRHCPRTILPTLPELTQLLCERLQYDPNYDYSVAEAEADSMAVDNGEGDYDEEDEDDDDYSDDEDSSWKVRRSAARALEAVVLIYPEMTPSFYDSVAPLLIRRFNEHEESVRLAIFACFGALLRQTRLTTPGAVAVTPAGSNPMYGPLQRMNDGFPSSSVCVDMTSDAYMSELHAQLQDPTSAQFKLHSLLPSLCRAIQKQASVSLQKKLRSTSNANRGAPGVQHAAFLLNRDLAIALPGQLDPYLDDILAVIHASSKDPNTNNTVKVDMINLVVLLLSTHPVATFKTKLNLLVQLAVWAMDDPFYRVALEGLELVQLLAAALRRLGGEAYAETLFDPLFRLLDANDRDLELKEKAIASVAVFIAQVGDLIGTHLQKCLQVIHRRLTNELTRLAAVRAIHIIAVSPFALERNDFLSAAARELATFLSKSDRILRLATLRCLYSIWSKHPQTIGSDCLNTVLTLVPKMLITEQDLQTAQMAIHLVALLLEWGDEVGSHVSQVLVTDTFMQPIISLAHSPLLCGQALDAMLRLMRAIGRQTGRSEKDHIITMLFVAQLLAPLNGSGLIACGPNTSPTPAGALHRDALPSLAQCIAELLADLPIANPLGQSTSPKNVNSLTMAVDRLLAAVKNPESSAAQVYLDLLILGELGSKIDLSNRVDLREMLISCLSTPVAQSTSSDKTAHSPNGSLIISEEVKPAAALSLGRLVAGQSDNLLPFLVDRISEAASAATVAVALSSSDVNSQHQLYHLLQALRKVLVSLAGLSTNATLKSHLDSIWSLLIASAGLSAEGIRNIVAECLGRLIFVSPRQLMDRLRQQLNSPEASNSPLIRCTLVTAVKFILVVTDLDNTSQNQLAGQLRNETLDWPSGLVASPLCIPQSGNQAGGVGSVAVDSIGQSSALHEIDAILRQDQPSSVLLDFLSRLADPDLLVRRAALIALNTAAHHRPTLVRPLLTRQVMTNNRHGQTSLIQLLYTETVVRKELIREVQMGPFKHYEDDGLDTRKCAFECMATLLETCLDRLTMSEFLEPLIEGLKDHTDIKLMVYQMLQRVVQIRPLEIDAKMDVLSPPLKSVLLSKPKEDWVKQEMEKMQELSRCAVAVVASFKAIEDIDKNRYYVDLVRTIEADPSLRSFYALAQTTQSSTTVIPGTLGGSTTPKLFGTKRV